MAEYPACPSCGNLDNQEPHGCQRSCHTCGLDWCIHKARADLQERKFEAVKLVLEISE